MSRGMSLMLACWTVGVLTVAVNGGDNTIYSSQYRRFVNQQSIHITVREQSVRNWLQCGSVCSRMGLSCLGFNLLANQANKTYPYKCEIKSLPLANALKFEATDCIYYDLVLEGPNWTVHNDACLPGHDDDTILDVTLDQCWSRCKAAGQSVCNSVDYDHTARSCFMSEFSVGDARGVLVSPCSSGNTDTHWYTYMERRLARVDAGTSTNTSSSGA